MNATFPYVLPVVKLPSVPRMNVMDAGLRDNFGAEVANRYLFVLRNWLAKNTRETIYLDLRDTRENEVTEIVDQSSSLGKMMADPAFVIQNKWEAFQSYSQGMYKDIAPYFLGGKLHVMTLQYVPKKANKIAALNFHLTKEEKEDIYQSIYDRGNKATIDTLVQLLRQAK